MKGKKLMLVMAFERGVEAFNQGIKCAPCLDKTFCETFLKDSKVGEGIAPMKAWLSGWTKANLSVPLK